MAGMQRKYENKVADLQTTVDKLLKVIFPTPPSLHRSSACTLKKTLCFHTSQKRTRKCVLKCFATDSIVHLRCPVTQTVTYQKYSLENRSNLHKTFSSWSVLLNHNPSWHLNIQKITWCCQYCYHGNWFLAFAIQQINYLQMHFMFD